MYSFCAPEIGIHKPLILLIVACGREQTRQPVSQRALSSILSAKRCLPCSSNRTRVCDRRNGPSAFVSSVMRTVSKSAPIVVVTGANRGIGFEISRQLATRGAQVILTARKLEAGKAAVKKLAAQNLTVQFRPLDVTSSKSIIALGEFLKRTNGRVDVLINNAGIIAKGDAPGLEVARSLRFWRLSCGVGSR
jgi:short chain dehydrogenase